MSMTEEQFTRALTTQEVSRALLVLEDYYRTGNAQYAMGAEDAYGMTIGELGDAVIKAQPELKGAIDRFRRG